MFWSVLAPWVSVRQGADETRGYREATLRRRKLSRATRRTRLMHDAQRQLVPRPGMHM